VANSTVSIPQTWRSAWRQTIKSLAVMVALAAMAPTAARAFQGTSAPALTGSGFARSHLTAAQLRAVVTQTMPLTAPGSLNPDDYAAVMAFVLSYDCVKPAGGGRQPFPTADSPALQSVTLGATTCEPKAGNTGTSTSGGLR
jgi:hypothetical protein